MNVNEYRCYYSNYIRFLECTRAEMYYYAIEPIFEILGNHELTDYEKLNSIKQVSEEFSNTMDTWYVLDYNLMA